MHRTGAALTLCGRRCVAAVVGLLGFGVVLALAGTDDAIRRCVADLDASERDRGALATLLQQERERAELAGILAAQQIAECRREVP